MPFWLTYFIALSFSFASSDCPPSAGLLSGDAAQMLKETWLAQCPVGFKTMKCEEVQKEELNSVIAEAEKKQPLSAKEKEDLAKKVNRNFSHCSEEEYDSRVKQFFEGCSEAIEAALDKQIAAVNSIIGEIKENKDCTDEKKESMILLFNEGVGPVMGISLLAENEKPDINVQKVQLSPMSRRVKVEPDYEFLRLKNISRLQLNKMSCAQTQVHMQKYKQQLVNKFRSDSFLMQSMGVQDPRTLAETVQQTKNQVKGMVDQTLQLIQSAQFCYNARFAGNMACLMTLPLDVASLIPIVGKLGASLKTAQKMIQEIRLVGVEKKLNDLFAIQNETLARVTMRQKSPRWLVRTNADFKMAQSRLREVSEKLSQFDVKPTLSNIQKGLNDLDNEKSFLTRRGFFVKTQKEFEVLDTRSRVLRDVRWDVKQIVSLTPEQRKALGIKKEEYAEMVQMKKELDGQIYENDLAVKEVVRKVDAATQKIGLENFMHAGQLSANESKQIVGFRPYRRETLGDLMSDRSMAKVLIVKNKSETSGPLHGFVAIRNDSEIPPGFSTEPVVQGDQIVVYRKERGEDGVLREVAENIDRETLRPTDVVARVLVQKIGEGPQSRIYFVRSDIDLAITAPLKRGFNPALAQPYTDVRLGIVNQYNRPVIDSFNNHFRAPSHRPVANHGPHNLVTRPQDEIYPLTFFVPGHSYPYVVKNAKELEEFQRREGADYHFDIPSSWSQ